MNIVAKYWGALWATLVNPTTLPLRIDAEGRLMTAVGSGDASITNPLFVKSAPYTPLGYRQILSAALASAVGVTTPPTDTKVAVVYNSGTTAVRWRDDGTDPTAAIGMLLGPGEKLTYDGTVTALKFIRVADGAILDISYYK